MKNFLLANLIAVFIFAILVIIVASMFFMQSKFGFMAGFIPLFAVFYIGLIFSIKKLLDD